LIENGRATGGRVVGQEKPASQHEGGRPINYAVTPGGHKEDRSQTGFPVYHRKFANPAPLGLCAFATTTFVLSMENVNVRNLNATPEIVVGMAFAYGGLAQLLAGMWEFAAGNTFGATAFSSYGAFWISFACIYVPWFNILPTLAAVSEETVANAVGLYLASWFIVTFIFLLACLRSSVALISVFFFLTLTFMMLMIGDFAASSASHTAGGALGIITAFCAWYTALAGLLAGGDGSFFVLPVGEMPKRD